MIALICASLLAQGSLIDPGDVSGVFGSLDDRIYIEGELPWLFTIWPSGRHLTLPHDNPPMVFGADEHGALVYQVGVAGRDDLGIEYEFLNWFPEPDIYRIRGEWAIGFGQAHEPLKLFHRGIYVCSWNRPYDFRYGLSVNPTNGSVAMALFDHGQLRIRIGTPSRTHPHLSAWRTVKFTGAHPVEVLRRYEFAGKHHLLCGLVYHVPPYDSKCILTDIDIRSFETKPLATLSFKLSVEPQELDPNLFCITSTSVFFLSHEGVRKLILPKSYYSER